MPGGAGTPAGATRAGADSGRNSCGGGARVSGVRGGERWSCRTALSARSDRSDRSDEAGGAEEGMSGRLGNRLEGVPAELDAGEAWREV